MSLFGIGRRRAKHAVADRRPRKVAAAALALGTTVLAMVFAAPAFATSVSSVSFSGSTQAGRATNASWTVGFTTSPSGSLKKNSTITVAFASGFVVPASPSVSLGTGFSQCTATASGSSSTVTVTLGAVSANSCDLPNNTGAALTISGITNPAAGTYGASVATSGDTTATSVNVTITPGSPAKLAFTTATPSTGTAGSALTTFKVSVEDADGNTITSGTGATDAISLAIATGPSGGTFNSASSTYTNVAAASGVATFSAVVLNTMGSYTLTASDSSRTGVTTATSGTIVISAATANKVAFVQGPSDAFAGSAMSPNVTVQVQDQYGNAVSSSGVSVTLTPSTGVINAGATATTNASGLATFSAVTINTAVTGLTLTATASGLTVATSSSFTVSVQVTATAASLTETATDVGSGVQSVSYYYCAGFAGTCTNGTLIGSSSNAASTFSVTWSSRPAAGAYRLVVVGTDNVGNVSTPSASIPVTVSN
jgi:hypothetical protein